MNAVLAKIKNANGMMSRVLLDELVTVDPMRMVLVRTNMGRFLAPARYVGHYANIIERDGIDYVRDFSLPSNDPIYK